MTENQQVMSQRTAQNSLKGILFASKNLNHRGFLIAIIEGKALRSLLRITSKLSSQKKNSEEGVLKFHFSATPQVSNIPKESNIHWLCFPAERKPKSNLKQYSAYIQLPVTSEFYVREQTSEGTRTPKAVSVLQGCI